MSYFNENHYPEHFILVGEDPLFFETESDSILHEALRLYPERFQGETPCFSFELRYAAPYDKDFKELKRLQGTAATYAGRRSTFKGFIIIDVSEYLLHVDHEPFFKMFLDYLYDQSDDWKYIFCVNNRNSKAGISMVRKLLSIPKAAVIEQAKSSLVYDKHFLTQVCQENHLSCSRSVLRFFEESLYTGICDRDAVSVIIQEIAGTHGTKQKVSFASLNEYVSSSPVSMKYMISKKNWSKLTQSLKLDRKEEISYEEKA